MSDKPVQFPWEIPPSRARASSQYLKRAANNSNLNPGDKLGQGQHYLKGHLQNVSTSSSVPTGSWRGGLSNRNTGWHSSWFRKVSPSKVLQSELKNPTKPIYQSGKVLRGSKSTALAGRGAVSLAVIKHGGGGGGAFSK